MKLFSTKDEDRTSFYKILMVLGLLLFFFFIKNIFIDQALSSIDEIDRYINMSERLESLSNWKEKEIGLRQKINKLATLLSKNKKGQQGMGESSLGLLVIDSLAKTTKVQVEEIKMSKPGKEKRVNSFNAIIKIRGRYFNISDFIEKIEKQPTLINVKQFTVKTSSLYSQNIHADINVELLF